MTRRRMTPLVLVVTLSLPAVPVPAAAEWPVFDASNYTQNLIQAARALQQITNQIQSLQNQAMMLQNMAKNLTSLNLSALDPMLADLRQVSALMAQAQGIAFTVTGTQRALAQIYPQSDATTVAASPALSNAHKRWQNSMAALTQTMTIQAQIVQNITGDNGTLSSLTTASQAAVGALQAQQATNQLIALSTKQQLQMQTLMAAQYRASSLEQARRAEAEEEARAASARFLGTANAYTSP